MKGKRITPAVIIVIIVISVMRLSPIPYAKADGASSTEEVFIQWRMHDNIGYTGEQGNGNNNKIIVGEMNITYQYEEIDADIINVYYYRGYIYSSDTDTRLVSFLAYKYDAANDPKELITYYDAEVSEGPSGAYSWRGYQTYGLEINSTMGKVGDDWVFFIGMDMERTDDDGNMYHSYGDGGDTTGYYSTYGFAPDYPDAPPDPLVEDADTNQLLPQQIRFYGFKNNVTDYNLYTGNATHYTARRDINYTFPTGVDTQKIRMTYPISEAILNVTIYAGGAWNYQLDPTEYSTAAYNSTHEVLTIPEATVVNYGGIYRVYTSTFAYYYDVGGAFFENGTSYGAVDITAETEGGTVTYNINGATGIPSTVEIFSFQWDVGDAYRFIYPRSTHESFNIFFPDDNYATYEFELRDFTGDLYTGGVSYVESYRFVNGSEAMIERILIQDVVNDIPLTLVTYQTYTLKIVLPDESTYNFGLFVTGALANPILALTEMAFSSRAQITYAYVTVEATRLVSTQITVNYNDTLSDTDSVVLLIEFRNGTDVFTETINDEDSYQWNFASADPYTDYVVTATITHGIFGTMTYREVIGVDRTFNPFPSLGGIGTFGPIDPGNLLSILIVSVCALAFSFLSAEVGGFVAVLVAATLRYWGVNDFDYTMLSIAGGIVVMYALMRRSTK